MLLPAATYHLVVADDFWPLPRYSEILFARE